MPSILDPWATATSYGVASGSGSFSSAVTESLAQLEALWINAGGPVSFAPNAAAIAEIESGGNPTSYNATQATGDQSFGLWQINTAPNANHQYSGQVASSGTASIFNPATNAADAVAVYGSQGAGAWAAETSPTSSKYGQYMSLVASAPAPSSPAVTNATSPVISAPNAVTGAISGAVGAISGAVGAVANPVGSAVSGAVSGATSAIGAWFAAHPLGLLVAGIVLLVVAWSLIVAPNISLQAPIPAEAA